MRRRAALRGAMRSALSRMLGERHARAGYDAVSAARELAWNSWRRRLHPSFWQRARDDQRAGVRRYAIHGEFGDALLALPFLHFQRWLHPDERLAVVIRGEAGGAAVRTAGDPYSESALRVMSAGDGHHSVNFLREFWQSVPFLDEVSEGDIHDPSLRYWQPQPAFTFGGKSVGPSDYAPFLEGLFSQDDRCRAEALWARSSRPLRIVLHLRRSAAFIVELAATLDTTELGANAAFAVVGSRKHEQIPDLTCLQAGVLDLTDNYEKGIAVMPLLQVIRTADLFIGGRGGFELFALVAATPAITVFDEDGWWEQRRLWPQRLWDENPLGGFVRASRSEPHAVLASIAAPWLRKRLARRRASAAVGSAG